MVDPAPLCGIRQASKPTSPILFLGGWFVLDGRNDVATV
jgi:hypothetical protein